ncbi:MAG TPA: hypothetical protein VMU08_18775 [Rhizomicrobium sp.]|nr:hypothetical protein [Rhizomicrobium sp.]
MTSIRGLEWPLVASIAAAAILAAPLWCAATPAMPDYPAHLASFALIGGLPSRYYTVAWSLVPNLAAETIVPLLAKALPLEVATKAFLTATVILWALGPAALQRALFGRTNPAALLGAFFAYNANFMWGFFNYCFAAGLSFFLLAAWIASDRRWTALHYAAFALAFTILYFCHLFALAVLLLAIGGYELSGALAERPWTANDVLRRLVRLVGLCVPSLIFFLLKPAAAGNGLTFDLLDTMQDRIEAAIQYGFDQPAWLLTVLLVAAFAVGVTAGRLVVHPRMRVTLILLAAGVLFAPEWALGGWGVHLRLPAVLGVLALGSTDWKMPRYAFAAGTLALAVTMAGAGALTLNWRAYDAQYAEFRGHAADIGKGGRLLTVLDGDSLGWDPDQPYWHMAEFAVIDRAAFTPLMFTTTGQHVIQVRPPFDRIAASTAAQGSPPDVDELDDLAARRRANDEDLADLSPYLSYFQCHFDQAIVIYGRGPHSRVPAMLRLRSVRSFYALYDIVPDARCRST